MKSLLTTLFVFMIFGLFSQAKEKENAHFGILIQQQFNHRTFHSSVCFEFNKDIFSAYIGPSFSIFGDKFISPDPVDFYSRNNIGFNTGFRLGPYNENKLISPFFQLNFNIVRAEFSIYQMGPSTNTKRHSWIKESSAGLGLNFNLSDDFKFFIGGGISSMGGSKNNSSKLVPHSFLGTSIYF